MEDALKIVMAGVCMVIGCALMGWLYISYSLWGLTGLVIGFVVCDMVCGITIACLFWERIQEMLEGRVE